MTARVTVPGHLAFLVSWAKTGLTTRNNETVLAQNSYQVSRSDAELAHCTVRDFPWPEKRFNQVTFCSVSLQSFCLQIEKIVYIKRIHIGVFS